MDFVQKHVDTNADITVSCIPMDERYLNLFYTVLGLIGIDGVDLGCVLIQTDQIQKRVNGERVKQFETRQKCISRSKTYSLLSRFYLKFRVLSYY